MAARAACRLQAAAPLLTLRLTRALPRPALPRSRSYWVDTTPSDEERRLIARLDRSLRRRAPFAVHSRRLSPLRAARPSGARSRSAWWWSRRLDALAPVNRSTKLAANIVGVLAPKLGNGTEGEVLVNALRHSLTEPDPVELRPQLIIAIARQRISCACGCWSMMEGLLYG